MKDPFQRRLLSWYELNRRPLPWRNEQDPYRIWISEVMLQQTRVDTAIAYYHRFLERFPKLSDLAEAELDDVMRVWQGLGYYSRARNLHKAARIMNIEYGGVPDELEILMSLPGIGRYTAGAVASIAFGKRVPVLDGNVIRVLSRIRHITENTDQPQARERLWHLSGSLLPADRIEDFNQALMELGAMVCLPRNPHCDQCPVLSFCEARRLGIQNQLPVKSPRKPVPHHTVTAGIVWRDERTFLITLRKPSGLLGGLWEFPGGKQETGETLESCLRRELREELGIDVRVGELFYTVKHAYTHFRITLHVFHCRRLGGRIRCRECSAYRWTNIREIDDFAFPAADRKVIEKLKNLEVLNESSSLPRPEA